MKKITLRQILLFTGQQLPDTGSTFISGQVGLQFSLEEEKGRLKHMCIEFVNINEANVEYNYTRATPIQTIFRHKYFYSITTSNTSYTCTCLPQHFGDAVIVSSFSTVPLQVSCFSIFAKSLLLFHQSFEHLAHTTYITYKLSLWQSCDELCK